MKAFKTFKAAKRAAQGAPIVNFGDLWIVGANSLTAMYIFEGKTEKEEYSTAVVGSIVMGHLARLGNANYAKGGRACWDDKSSDLSFDGVKVGDAPLVASSQAHS